MSFLGTFAAAVNRFVCRVWTAISSCIRPAIQPVGMGDVVVDADMHQQRRFIFFAVVMFTFFGSLMVYESSSMYALRVHGDPTYFFVRQLAYIGAGIALFFISLTFDIEWMRRHSSSMLAITVVLLAAVLFVGKSAGGAVRWFRLPGFALQPSELLKISFLFFGIDYFIRKGADLQDIKKGLLPLGILIGGISLLLLKQPDLGNVIFWLIWTLICLFVYGVRMRHIAAGMGAGVILLSFLIFLQPYRFRRITAYLNPFADPRGAGFQLIQSQIAFGNGGVWGVGLGDGYQKLFFLPAAHTDFIFSIIAEEFGLLGSLTVLGLFFVIFCKMILLVQCTRDVYRRGIMLGIVVIFFLEILGNIGVASGLFPTKGLSFPFLSYGGSNMLVHFCLLGLFFNASRPLCATKARAL